MSGSERDREGAERERERQRSLPVLLGKFFSLRCVESCPLLPTPPKPIESWGALRAGGTNMPL